MPFEVAVIIVTSLLLLVILFGFLTLNRYLSYKERVALARLGFTANELGHSGDIMRQGNRGVLWGGVITMMSGLALLLGLSPLGSGVWLIAGLLPLFVGVGMLLIYFITAGTQNRQTEPGAAFSPDEDPDDIPEPTHVFADDRS
jgi:hypothetical protein